MTNDEPRPPRKLSVRVKFLFVMIAVYGVVALFDPEVAVKALRYFRTIVMEVIPVLALVFVILFLSNAFLKPERIRRHLGEGSGLLGWLYAIIGGIIISGPPYILYPMLGEMQKRGARNALLAAMLYNRNVKIHFLPAMVYYFGLRYTVVLSVYIILFSILNGKVLELLTQFRGRQA